MPRLTGAMKAVDESIAYTAGDTVRWSSHIVPHPSFDWTDAAFEFSFK